MGQFGTFWDIRPGPRTRPPRNIFVFGIKSAHFGSPPGDIGSRSRTNIFVFCAKSRHFAPPPERGDRGQDSRYERRPPAAARSARGLETCGPLTESIVYICSRDNERWLEISSAPGDELRPTGAGRWGSDR